MQFFLTEVCTELAINGDEVDADGMRRDVQFADIFDEGDDGPRTLNKCSPTADVQQFFEKEAIRQEENEFLPIYVV